MARERAKNVLHDQEKAKRSGGSQILNARNPRGGGERIFKRVLAEFVVFTFFIDGNIIS